MNAAKTIKLWGIIFLCFAAFWMGTAQAFTPNPTPTNAVLSDSASEAAASTPLTNEIQLISPAPFSQVLSPIPVELTTQLYRAKTLRLDLLDANGDILSRKVYSFRTCDSNEQSSADNVVLDIPVVSCFQSQAMVKTSLNFLMDKPAQKGYLQVIIADENHRIRRLETVELQLLTYGKQVLHSAPINSGSLKILTPVQGAEIKGGKLTIQGEATYMSSLPLRVFLITEDGQVVGSRMAGLAPPSSSSLAGTLSKGTFNIEVPYRVKQPKAALLSVALYSEAFKGPYLLNSLEVMLNP